MPNAFLLSHATGELELTRELLESHVEDALSGEMKIVDIKNLNFLNLQGEWEEIEGKEEIEDEEISPYSFKLGARRVIDLNTLWDFCKLKM